MGMTSARSATPARVATPNRSNAPAVSVIASIGKASLWRGRFKSLWNFWEHGVTSSFLNSFLNCLEQTKLHFVDGWGVRGANMAFDFGTCMHWCLEQAYLGRMGKNYFTSLAEKETWCGHTLNEYESRWRDELQVISPKLEDHVQLCMGLSSVVLPVYFDRWSGDFTGTYAHKMEVTRPARWDSLEEVFDVPYVYPDGKVTHLRGRRDGVFVDRRERYWVFDTKCRSVIKHEEAMETLPFDVQQMFYMWITHEQMKQRGFKHPYPTGVQMNIIRRPGHRRKKGKAGDEPLHLFLERVAEDVEDPKLYDHNFTRYEMAIHPKELMRWKQRQLDPMMKAVRMWWEGTLPHYMNPNSLVTKYGPAGLFRPICKNDYSDAYRREVVFSELAA